MVNSDESAFVHMKELHAAVRANVKAERVSGETRERLLLAIVAALDDSVPVVMIASETGLSRSRLYQIRREHEALGSGDDDEQEA